MTLSKVLVKIVAGGEFNKTRCHDQKGNFCGWSQLMSHAPLAAITGLLRLSIGYRPQRPWIGFSTAKVFEDFLTKDSRVLEFGSGMSTIWYAKRAGYVCAVEDSQKWFQETDRRLKSLRLNNVKYCYASEAIDYCNCGSSETFDLIVVDGKYRSQCVVRSLRLLRDGGMLYLDNSDMDSTPSGGEMRLAEQHVLDYAASTQGTVTYVTDFPPGNLFVHQGMILRSKSDA